MSPLKVSIFDPGLFDPRQNRDNEVIDQLFELVPIAEKLGFHRYWLGEHYEYGVAWRSPEILLSLLAGFTENIRIGIAGVLLLLHSPLKIVQNYKLLEYLFANRIDLGIAAGRAPKEIMPALLNGTDELLKSYPELVQELIQFMDQSFPEKHPYQKITTPLQGVGRPEMWLLTTGGSSSTLASQHQFNLCFSLFHVFSKEGIASDVLRRFRDQYEQTHHAPATTSIAVAGVCAETYAQAMKLKESYMSQFFVPKIFGTPENCREQILTLKDTYQVDEITFLDLCPDFHTRLQSMHYLAEALQLSVGQANPV